MKGLKRIFGVLVLVCSFAVMSVSAEVQNDLSLDNAYTAGGEISIEELDHKRLEVGGVEGDYHSAKLTVNITKTSIDTILNQKSGNGSNLGIYYVGVIINDLAKGDGNKLVRWAGYVPSNSNEAAIIAGLEDIKAKADEQYESADYDVDLQHWLVGLRVYYNNNGTWEQLKVDGLANRSKSVKDALVEKLGHDLETNVLDSYGKDFIFALPENQDTIALWKTDDNVYNYLKMSYEIKFPVNASNGETVYSFYSVEEAIKEVSKLGINNITLNVDDTIDEEITIPAGVTINVVSGVTLNVTAPITFANGASINGTVSYASNVKAKYAVTVNPSENGEVTVDKATAEKGEVVTIKTAAKEGYELATLEVIDAKGNKIDVVDGKFVMPEGTVTVTATYKAIATASTTTTATPENPATIDNIALYVGISLISLAGVYFGIKVLNNRIKSN